MCTYRKSTQLLCLAIVITIFVAAVQRPVSSSCIKNDTWGAFTDEDFDLMMAAVTKNEVNLFAQLMTQHRIVKVSKNTRIVIVKAGWTRSKIRPVNTDIQVFVVNEAIVDC